MNDTEREERNARRRRDPNRALDFVMLPLSTLRDMVEASPRQCQDCIGLFLYLAEHPQIGNFIPEAATWGKDKCGRTLRIRGKIAADCALFCRESGGVRCTGWPLEKVAQALEKRKTYSDNRKGKTGGGVQSIDCSIDAQSKEEEGEKEYLTRREPPPISPAAAQADDGAQDAQPHAEAVEGMQAKDAGMSPRPADSQLTPQGVREIFVWAFREAGVTDERYLDECATAFLNDKERNGWVDGECNPIANRTAATWAYAKACAKNYAADTKTPQELEGAWEGRPTPEQVAEYFRGWITDDRERESASIAFRQEMNRRNWKTTRGNPMKNWQRMAANFIERYMRRAH